MTFANYTCLHYSKILSTIFYITSLFYSNGQNILRITTSGPYPNHAEQIYPKINPNLLKISIRNKRKKYIPVTLFKILGGGVKSSSISKTRYSPEIFMYMLNTYITIPLCMKIRKFAQVHTHTL